MESLFYHKKQVRIQPWEVRVAAYLSNISIKKIVLKNNYVLNCGIPPAFSMSPPVVLASCFALPALALPMLAHAAHTYI